MKPQLQLLIAPCFREMNDLEKLTRLHDTYKKQIKIYFLEELFLKNENKLLHHFKFCVSTFGDHLDQTPGLGSVSTRGPFVHQPGHEVCNTIP